MLLRQKVTATSDAHGNISFTFLTVPVNQAWTGSFAIPTAPASAAFVLNLETGEHGGWGGPTPWGPLRLSPSEVATITGGGLQPTTSYTAVLIGDQQPSGVLANVPYPAPQTGQSPAIPPADVLSTQQTVTVTSTAAVFTVASVPSAYETILVSIAPTTTNASATYAVQVQNLTTGVFSAWQSILAAADSNGSPLTGPLYFPISFRVNDVLRLHFVTLDGSSTPTDISIEGLGAPIQPSLLRPEGRLMPAGSRVGEAPVLGTSNFNVLAAVTGVRFLIQSSSATFTGAALPAATNTFAIACTVQGKTVVLDVLVATTAGLFHDDMPIPDRGLLTDPGTAVIGSCPNWDGSTGLLGVVVYDLVV